MSNPVPETAAPVDTVGVVPGQTSDPLRSVASHVAARLEQTEIQALVEAVERAGQIPRDIDKQLLGGARAAIGRDLNPGKKKDVRKYFLEECRHRVT